MKTKPVPKPTTKQMRPRRWQRPPVTVKQRRSRGFGGLMRVNGFAPNGRITDGLCHTCGSAVQIQHGRQPGERYPRHLFWCDTCNGYGLEFPLDDYCQHCRQEATGEPIHLIRVGRDCHYGGLATSFTVAEIQAAAVRVRFVEPEPVARQLALF